jgi:hypothetical protein
MSDTRGLTTTDLLAIASDCLVAGSYQPIDGAELSAELGQNARLFEDPYGIVAVIVYETWSELMTGWADAQSALVETISKYISSSEAKAWDGYLVLLTPSLLTTEDSFAANEIRYDTSRLRKLVATGGELRGIADVERALLSLLPLQEGELAEPESPLAMLPTLLVARDVPEDAVRVLVDAFIGQAALLDRLHAHRFRE